MAGNGWRLVPLGSSCEVYDGPHATPKKTGDGPIFLGIWNLSQGRLDLQEVEHLSENDYIRWTRRVTPQPGDIVFSYETCLGEAAIIPDGLRCCLGRRMGLLRVRSGEADPRFLLYAYLGPAFQEAIRARTVQGSTVERILLTELPAFPIAVPPLGEQRAIAHILGTLDGKIELNRRTNETLEAIAQAIFKSWFVDFDPVRAKMAGRQPFGMDAATAALFPDSFEDSPLGKIPKGWEVGTIGALGEVICGKTPPTAEPRNYGGDTPFITIPDMHGRVFVTHTATTLSEAGTQTQPKKWLPALAVCVSCIATPGLSVLTSVPSHTNQQINAIVCRRGVSPFWCLLQVRSMRGEIVTGGAGGSATLNLNKGNFAAMPVLIPTEKCMGAFHVSVKPVFDHILVNESQSQSLGSIRDTLLPKLLSGQVRVKDAERYTAEVMP